MPRSYLRTLPDLYERKAFGTDAHPPYPLGSRTTTRMKPSTWLRWPRPVTGYPGGTLIRLGPCRCQGCDRMVWWNGSAYGSWTHRNGTPHRCPGRVQ
jgi:hypothetical protein